MVVRCRAATRRSSAACTTDSDSESRALVAVSRARGNSSHVSKGWKEVHVADVQPARRRTLVKEEDGRILDDSCESHGERLHQKDSLALPLRSRPSLTSGNCNALLLHVDDTALVSQALILSNQETHPGPSSTHLASRQLEPQLADESIVAICARPNQRVASGARASMHRQCVASSYAFRGPTHQEIAR